MELTELARRAECAKIIAVDLVADGPDARQPGLMRIRLSFDRCKTVSIDLTDPTDCVWEALRAALSTPAVKVLYRAQYQLQCLMAQGIAPCHLFDITLAAQLLYWPGESDTFDLPTLCARYLGKDWDAEREDMPQLMLRMRSAMVSQLRKNGLVDVAKIEFDCVRAVAGMEYHGIHLDRNKWRALTEKTAAEQLVAKEKLYAFSGKPLTQTTLWGEEESLDINFESKPFVLSLLREQGIAVDATGKRELYPYRAHPLVQALTQYRKASKLLSSFLEPLASMLHPVSGRLHPHYGQLTAYSGRMSCWNPNIQQIPRDREFRECFTAPPGRRLIIADYSQIELRVAAEISQDARMLAAYRHGGDLHALTASILTGKTTAKITKTERQAAKPVNFGLIFGMGPHGLQESARLTYGVEMTLEQAGDFSKRFFTAYSGVRSWHERIKAHPPKEGRTLTGRRFAYSGAATLPELSNSPVQGTAADIVKRALGLLAERLSANIWIVAAIHDEILLECPEAMAESAAAILKEAMEEAASGILPSVPAAVEVIIAGHWADK